MPSRAAGVTLVLSDQTTPHRQAAAGFRQAFQAPIGVRVMSLDEFKTNPEAIQDPAKEVYVAIGAEALAYLQAAENIDTPVVFCMVPRLQAVSWETNRSCWGVTLSVPVEEQLDVLAQNLPETKRLGMLYRSDDPSSSALKYLAREGSPSGWELEAIAVDDYYTTSQAVNALLTLRPDALWLQDDPAIFESAVVRLLLLKTIRGRIPTMGFSRELVRSGALLGVDIDPETQGAQAAELVTDVLAGKGRPDPERGAEAFGETTQHWRVAPRFELAMNHMVAKQIGINFSTQALQDVEHHYGKE